MAERIRFHLDEQMDPDSAIALRRNDIDVTTPVDQKLLGETDAAHLVRDRSQGRVLVTDDTDFLIIARSTDDHAGIVYCRRTKHSMGEIIRFLILLHGVYEPKDMIGRVEFP